MKGYAITLDDIPLSNTLLSPIHDMCELGSAHCLTYVTQSFGGHQKIVWHSPTDYRAFVILCQCFALSSKKNKKRARQ